MDLNKVKTFCKVVDCGSMAKASEQLFCSQPAISKQILVLEDELGYALFDRYGKKMVLNASGKLVYAFGKACEAKLRKLQDDLRELNAVAGSTVVFGSNNYVGMYIIPNILAHFKAEHPEVALNFSINFTPNILKMLDEDRIEFALVPEFTHIHSKEYQKSVFFRDSMKLIMPCGHPMTKLATVTFPDILKYPFLISRNESLTREYVVKYFKEQGVLPTNTLDLHNSESIKQGVLKGIGISIIAEELVKSEIAQQKLVAVDIYNKPMQRRLYIVHKKSTAVSQKARLFIEHLQHD